MEMVLREGGIRDDGLNVDPVSGNEIPSGSLAEEVRDDIPAQLSGGEYVVPADVVRFFGVKYFEDLRMEAKLGLQDMERNGRIGGEPVEPQQQMAQNSNQGITEADLQALEAMMTTGAYEGGLMDKIAYTVKNDPMVNERVNKKGTSVGFAEGGQVSSMFADPNEIDSIIDQVSIMAQQNPAIAKELNQRGISVGQMPKQANTQQMQPRNTPAQVTNPVSQQMAVGGTPDPFARFRVPGLSSSSGMGMPQAVTPDITATPTPVVSDPATAPAVATPDVGQCGEGRMWNGFQCVPAQRTGDDNGDGGSSGGEGGGGSGSFGESWVDEGGFTGKNNLSNFIDKELGNLAPAAGSRPDQNPFSNLVKKMPAMQILSSIEGMRSVAKTRAAAQLNFDAELISKEEYEAALSKIDSMIPSNLLKAANSGLATGYGNTVGGKRKAKKLGFDYDDDGKVKGKELRDWMKSLGVEESAQREADRKELARLAAERSAQQVAQQQAAARRNPNVIPGSGGGDDGPNLLPSQVKSGYEKGEVKDLTGKQRETINDSRNKIDRQDADSFEDLNKGGLMKKRKKK